MNNLQHIVKDNTRYAMHLAVELCEQGDFDSVTDAFKWLMQERDDSEPDSVTCKNIAPEYLDFLCSECGFVHYHSDENDTGDGNDWAFCPQCGRRVKR